MNNNQNESGDEDTTESVKVEEDNVDSNLISTKT